MVQQILKNTYEYNNLFYLYQPIINTQTNQVERYEALMRLKIDGITYLPDMFFPIFREQNMYNQLNFFGLKKVIQDLMKYPSLKVNFNISMSDIRNKSLTDLLYYFCKELEDKDRLMIEIVECEELDQKMATNFIEIFKKMGIKIALDDYGSKYANLTALNDFNFDIIKINGNFMKTLHSKKTQALLENMCLLSKKLNVELIAEYIENAEILDLIDIFEIKYHQGYYYGEPASLTEIMT